jgi:hypothetical protein
MRWPAYLPSTSTVGTLAEMQPFIHNAQREKRWLKLNTFALEAHGTLEFRQPQSSTCVDEVCCVCHVKPALADGTAKLQTALLCN